VVGKGKRSRSSSGATPHRIISKTDIADFELSAKLVLVTIRNRAGVSSSEFHF